jgi:hypothetical protein
VPIPDDVEDSFRELAEINVGYFILDKMLMAQAGEDVEIWRGAIPFQPIYEDNFLLVYTTKTE